MEKTMSTWKPTVCIYHGGCVDGFTAAWAVWRKWGDDVRYVPMGYGDTLPEVLPTDRVLMVDFSLKRDVMVALARAVEAVVVLDHHKTAKAELEPMLADAFPMSPAGAAECIYSQGPADLGAHPELRVCAFFDMEKSGARMAWEFCFPGVGVPMFVRLVEDRDLWRFQFKDTKPVHRFLASLPQQFAEWEAAFYEHESARITGVGSRCVEIGTALLDDHDRNVQATLVNTHERIIAGHRVPCVNVPYWMASDTGHELLKKFPEAPFVATFFIRGDGARQYSLRSEDSRVDVSEVAKRYGGGGHRNAAGFQVPE